MSNIPKTEKIIVLGAGCVGLYTAIVLYKNGYSNVEIVAEKTEDLASHNCGAIYSAASMLAKLDDDMRKYAEEIFVGSYVVCKDILLGKHFIDKNGITEIDGYFGDEPEVGAVYTNSGMDIIVEKGLIPPPETVNLKLGNQMNRMRKYRCIYFHPFLLMNNFNEILKKSNISIRKAKITNFNEMNSNYIFNCSGLGSRNLKSDNDVLHVLGHVIHLRNQNLIKLNYYIYTHYITQNDIGKYNHDKSPLLYFMPKTDNKSITGIIGGSYITNSEGKDNELNKKEYYI